MWHGGRTWVVEEEKVGELDYDELEEELEKLPNDDFQSQQAEEDEGEVGEDINLEAFQRRRLLDGDEHNDRYNESWTYIKNSQNVIEDEENFIFSAEGTRGQAVDSYYVIEFPHIMQSQVLETGKCKFINFLRYNYLNIWAFSHYTKCQFIAFGDPKF